MARQCPNKKTDIKSRTYKSTHPSKQHTGSTQQWSQSTCNECTKGFLQDTISSHTHILHGWLHPTQWLKWMNRDQPQSCNPKMLGGYNGQAANNYPQSDHVKDKIWQTPSPRLCIHEGILYLGHLPSLTTLIPDGSLEDLNSQKTETQHGHWMAHTLNKAVRKNIQRPCQTQCEKWIKGSISSSVNQWDTQVGDTTNFQLRL